jgi:hypothetical protein
VETSLSSTPPDGVKGTFLTKDYSATGGSRAPLLAYAAVFVAEHRTFPYNFTLMGDFFIYNALSLPKEEEIPTEDTLD